jgi:hypothetical protein
VLERFVKSFAFSLLLGLAWGAFTFGHVRSLVRHFTWTEALWVLYNGSIAILFVIRTAPSVVSLDPVHWAVALLTSFSGMFFIRSSSEYAGTATLGRAMILAGLVRFESARNDSARRAPAA